MAFRPPPPVLVEPPAAPQEVSFTTEVINGESTPLVQTESPRSNSVQSPVPPREFGPPPPVLVEPPVAPQEVSLTTEVTTGEPTPLVQTESPRSNSVQSPAPPREFGPPPPVLVEPPADGDASPPIQVTHYQPAQKPTSDAPGLIFNPAMPTQYAPPPPVLIEDRPEEHLAESFPSSAPVVSATHLEARPAHLIADFGVSEPSPVPVVPSAAPRQLAPPAVLTTDDSPTLAPIVSPASVLRRIAPVRTGR
jgi:hypothetical protein